MNKYSCFHWSVFIAWDKSDEWIVEPMPLHAHSADPACSSVLVWLYLCDLQMSGQPLYL